MTLDALIAALGEKIQLDSRYDEENEEWLLDVHLEGGRNQEVRVFTFEEGGVEMVRVLTSIGSADDFSVGKIRTAMEVNASLLVGALALFQGEVVLTACAPIDGTHVTDTADAIGYIIRYVTRMADTYEKLLFGLDRA